MTALCCQLLLSMRLALEYIIVSITPLEKTDVPSPSRSQLQMASRLGVGLCAHFSLLGYCLAKLLTIDGN